MANRYRKTIYVLLLALLIVALFGSSVFLQDILQEFTATLTQFESQNPFLSAVIFIGLAIFSILLGPFTSIPLVPPAIVIWGVPTTLFFLVGGWLIGNSLAYFIGRSYGLTLVSKIVGEKKIDDWMNKIQGYLNFWLLLLFRFSTPSETGYAFGLIRYDFAKYILISFLAELPYGLLAVYASEALVSSDFRAYLNYGWAWVFAFIFGYILIIQYLKKSKNNNINRKDSI